MGLNVGASYSLRVPLVRLTLPPVIFILNLLPLPISATISRLVYNYKRHSA